MGTSCPTPSPFPWSEWEVRAWIACRHLLTHHIAPLPTFLCTALSQVAVLFSPQGIVLAFTQGQKCLLGPLSILMSCINMAIALKGQWRNQKPSQLFCCAVFISENFFMDIYSSHGFEKMKSLLQTQLKKYIRKILFLFFHLKNGSKNAVTEHFYFVPLYVL